MKLKQPIASLHKSELKMEGLAIPRKKRSCSRKKSASKKTKKGTKKTAKRKVSTYKMILAQ